MHTLALLISECGNEEVLYSVIFQAIRIRLIRERVILRRFSDQGTVKFESYMKFQEETRK